MQRLLDILRSFREYILFSFLILVSLFLLGTNDNPQLKEIRSYTVGFAGFLQSIFAGIPNVFELQRENKALRQINVDLADEVSRLREAGLENIRLRAMSGLPEKTKRPLIAADVVAKSIHLLRNMITLNVGSAEGIKPNMPIITESGLVGKTTATSNQFCVGQMMFHKDFRASVKIERSRVDGIIAWEGGTYLVMKNVPKKQDVVVGDIVLTSEYSNVFPRGIKVGRVVNVQETPAALFKDIEVAPAVDFTLLEQVFIVLQLPDTSRTQLEQQTVPAQ